VIARFLLTVGNSRAKVNIVTPESSTRQTGSHTAHHHIWPWQSSNP